jgi:lysophospholipase L1-like esterase
LGAFIVSVAICQSSVLCIGDSIRLGWAHYLVCEQPTENCGSSRNGVKKIDEWTKNKRWRIAVFNFGLHDSHHGVPLDEYRQNLVNIIRHIKADRVYFCTSTPGRPNGLPGWKPEDIERYNRAAIEVMRAKNVRVIDMHALVARHPEWWLENIHYTEAGYRGMADYVKGAIRDR